MDDPRRSRRMSRRLLSLHDPSSRATVVLVLLSTILVGMLPFAYGYAAPTTGPVAQETATEEPTLDPLTLLLEEDYVPGYPASTPGIARATKPRSSSVSSFDLETAPNVLFILTDDQTLQTLGYTYPSNPPIYTPELNWLAEHGTSMERMYVPNGTCAPSRASLWTGLLPHQHGVRTNGDPLSLSFDTLPRLLQDNGYLTYFVGKCHLSNPDDPDPGQFGFDRWAIMYPDNGSVAAGGNSQTWEAFDVTHSVGLGTPTPTLPRTPVVQTVTTYNTTALTTQAISYMLQAHNLDTPYFLWLGYLAPHHPTTPPTATPTGYPLYDKTSVPYPPASNSDTLVTKPRQQQLSRPHKGYEILNALSQQAVHQNLVDTYNVVTNIDYNVGRLLDWVRASERETLVVFMSDNGRFFGEHHMYQKGPTIYEEQVHMPFVITDIIGEENFGERVAQNRRSEALASSIDVMPTLLDLVGLGSEIPSDPEFPGQNFAAVLDPGSSPTLEHRDSVFFEYEVQAHASEPERVPLRGLLMR